MEDIVQILKAGGVGVLPTDTLYGLVGSALNPQVVERIYKLRKRSPNKPFIILISKIKDLLLFNVHLEGVQLECLIKIWPNPVSIILPVPEKKFEYLHRGTKTLAFRIPKKEDLLELLRKTGPLVAPSANFEGGKPAETIDETKSYFHQEVDFYIDQGKLIGEPSTLIKFENNRPIILRAGVFKIS